MTEFRLRSRNRLATAALFLALFCAGRMFGATVTWDGSDSDAWDTAANWDTGTVPTSADDVIIPDVGPLPNAPVLDVDTDTIISLTIDASGTLEIPATFTLSVSGAIINNGTITSSGDISCGDFTSSDTFTSGATNTITATGNVAISGTFDGTTTDNTLTMTGTATPTLNASVTLGNLEIDPGAGNSVALSANLILDGDLTITSGTFDLATNNRQLDVTGTLTNAGTITGGTATLGFGGAAANTGTITGGAGLVTFTGAVTDTGGTITAGTGGLSFLDTYDGSGGSVGALEGNATGGIAFQGAAAMGTFTSNGGTVTFSGTATPQTFNPNAQTFGPIVLSKGAQAQIVQLSGNLTISDANLTVTTGTLDLNSFTLDVNDTTGSAGDVSVAAAGGLDCSTAGSAVNLQGDWSVNAAGVFTAGTSTVTLDGSAAGQNVTAGGTDASHAFSVITDSNSFGAVSFTDNIAATTINVNGIGGAATFSGTVTAATIAVNNTGGNVTFSDAVTAGTVTLTNAGTTPNNVIAFQGNTSVTTGLSAANNGFAVSFTGASNDVAGSTTFLNDGGIIFGDADTDSITFAGGLVTTGATGTLTLMGHVLTTDTAMSLGPATLAADTWLDSGTGTLTLGNVDGTFDLDIACGAVTLGGAIGSGTVLASLVIAGSGVVALPVVTLDAGGSLSVTAGGNITQGGILTVPGTASFDPGAANSVALGGLANLFGTVEVAQGVDAAFRDANAIVLGAVTITGNLSVTAGASGAGNVTQSGVLDIGGTTTITAGTAGTTIDLSTQANVFDGAITVSGNGLIGNLLIRNDTGAAGMPTLPTGMTNLTLTWNSAGLTLPAVTLAAGGNLTVTAGGTIDQSGILTVPGTASFDPGAAGSVTLDTQANLFGTVGVTQGVDASFRDANAIILGATSISGNLVVTTDAGGITQSGALVIPGTSSFSATSGVITLTTGTNNFTGAVTLTNTGGSPVSITDTNGITIGQTSVTGALTIDGGGVSELGSTGTVACNGIFSATAAGNLTISNPISNGAFGVTITTSAAMYRIYLNYTGTVVQTDGGAVTFSRRVVLQQNSTIDTDAVGGNTNAGNVTFSNTVNAETAGTQSLAVDVSADGTGTGGTVTFSNSIGATAALSGLTVSGATTATLGVIGGGSAGVTGATSITASTSITLSGITYNANTQTYDAGGNTISLTAGAAVTFTSSDDDITFNGTVALANGSNLSITTGAATVGNVTMGAVTANSNETVTIAAGDGSVTIGAVGTANQILSVSLSGSLGITLNGTIITSSTAAANGVTITGPVILGADVTINTSAGNGAVSFSGATSTINSAVAQSLTVNAGTGAVTFGGAIGASTALSAFTVSAAATASLANIGGGSAGVTGITSISASSSITLSGTVYNANQQTYNAGAAANLISLTAGAATAFTSTADNITFTGTVTLANGSNLSVSTAAGAGNVTLGAVNGTSDETMTVNAGTGSVTVGAVGTANQILNVGLTGSGITLNGNVITSSTAASNGVTITGPVTLGANVTINTSAGNGAVSFSGATSTINALADGGQSLTVTSGSGTVGFGAAIGGGNRLSALTITTSAALALPAVNLFTAGNLIVTSGALTQSGALTIPGTTTIDAGANAITLTDGSNSFTGAVSLDNTGAAVPAQLSAGSTIDLGTCVIGNNLVVITTNAGGITNTAGSGITVGGTSSFTAPNTASITLGNTANDFTGSVTFTAAAGNLTNVTVYDSSAIDLGPLALSAAGTLTVTSEGAVTQTGGALSGATLVVKTLNDAGAAITLANVSNDFDTVDLRERNAADGLYTTAGISFADSDGFTVNAAVGSAGLVTLRAVAGTVSQAAACPVEGGGNLELLGGAAFTLTETTNDMDGLAAATTGAVSFTDTDGLTIGSYGTSTGIGTGGAALTLTAGAALSINQAVSAGTTQLTAVGISLASGITVDAGPSTILLDGNDGNIALSDGTLTTTSNGSPAITIRDAAAVTLGNITTGGAGTLALGIASPNHISGALSQTASTALSVGTVTCVTGGTITLNEAGNAIGTVGSVTRGDAVTITDGTDAMTVSGPVNLGTTTNAVAFSAAGLLTISGTAAITATTGAGSVSLSGVGVTNSGATVSGASGVTIAAGTGTFTNTGTVSSTNSLISITADDMALTGGTINSGTGGVNLIPATATRVIDIGTDTAGRLALTDTELDTITVTDPGVLTIGLITHNGQIIISAAAGPATAPNVALVNRNDGIDIRANLTATTDLTLTADGDGTETTGAITRSTGAGILTATGGDLTLEAATGIGVIAGILPVAIGTVGGALSATNTQSGYLFLDTGTITLAGAGASVSQCNDGTARIDSSGTITIGAGGTLSVGGTSGDIVLNADANIVISGDVTVGTSGTVTMDAGLAGAGTITRAAGTVTGGTVSMGLGGTTTSIGAAAAANHVITAATTALNLTSTTGDIYVDNMGAVTLGADTTSGNITVANTGNLTATAVASTSGDIVLTATGTFGTLAGGITTAGAADTVSVTSAGNMTIAHDVTGPAGVTLSVTGNNLSLTHSAGAIDGTNAAIALSADKMILSGGSIGSAAADTVTIVPYNGGKTVVLGSATDAAANSLELSTGEVGTITGLLIIGDGTNTSAVNVTAGISFPVGADPVHLITAGTVSGAGRVTVTAGSLAVEAANAVTLLTAADTIAVSATTGAVSVSDNNAGALDINTVDGVDGIVTAGTVSDSISIVKTNGILTITRPLDAGLADIDIDTDNNLSQGGAGTIACAGLEITGTGSSYDLSNGSNAITSVAASVTGSFSLSDADGYTVDLVGGTTGITVTGATNTVTLDAAGGNITLAEGITTNAGDITVSRPAVISGTVTVSTIAGVAGNIQFDLVINDTLAGTNGLTLTAGTGTITLLGAVGGTRLASLVCNSTNAAADAIDILGVATTGAQTYNGNVTTTGVVTLSSSTSGGIAINGAAAFGGNVTVNATAADIQITGTTAFSGTAAFTTTTSGAITLGDAITLGGTATFTTAGGGAISLAAVTGSGFTLALAGSGADTIASANLNTTGTLNLTGKTGGSVTVSGNLTTGTLSTAAQNYGILLIGGGSVANNTTFSNTGTLQVGDASGDSFEFTAGASKTAGTKTIAGTINTTNSPLGFGTTAVTAADDTNIYTGTGAVTLGDLTLNDGVDLVIGDGSAGPTVIIAGITPTLGGGNETVTVDTIGGNITVSGAAGASGNTLYRFTVSANKSGGTVAFQNDLYIDYLVCNAGAAAYAVSLTGTTTEVTYAPTFGSTGALTLGNGGDTLLFTAGFAATAPSGVSLGGNINASGTAAITVGDAGTPVTAAYNTTFGGVSTGTVTIANGGTTTIANGVTLTLGNGAAVKPFQTGSIAGVAAGLASNLTINTAGAVTIGGTIGTDIGTVLVSDSAGVNFSDTVTAATVTLTDTTGLITFTGLLTAGTFNTAANAYDLSILGGASVTNAASIDNTGDVVLGDNPADVLLFSGGLGTSTAYNSLAVGGMVRSQTAGITLADFSLSTNSVLDSTNDGAGTGQAISIGDASYAGFTLEIITGSAGSLTAGTLTGDYLRIVSGAGVTVSTAVSFLEISAGGAISVNEANDVTLGFGGGSYNFAGGLVSSAGGAAITLTAGGAVTTAEAISSTNGPVTIDAAGVLSLGASAGIDAGSSTITITASDMTVGAAIDADTSITLMPAAAGTVIRLYDAAGGFNLDLNELQFLACLGTVYIGRAADGSGAINVGSQGTVDLSGESFDLTIQGTSSNLLFNSAGAAALSLVSGGILTIDIGTGTVTSPGGATTDVSIAGTGILDIASGAIGASGTPLIATVGTLRVDAAGDIFISETNGVQLGDGTGGITGSGGIEITVNGTITTGNTVSSTGGGGSAIDISNTAGNITVTYAVTAAGSDTIAVDSAALFTLANGIVVSSGTGAVSVTSVGTLTVNGDITTGGAMTITSSAGVTMDTGSLIRGGTTVDVTSGNAGIVFDVIESTGSDVITVAASGGGGGPITEADNTARLGAAGSNSILVLSGTTLGASGNGALNTDVATLRLTATGAAYINETSGIALGDGIGTVTSSGGLLWLNAAGAVTTGNTISTTGGGASHITIISTGSTIDLNNPVTTAEGGTVTITNNGLLTITAAAPITAYGGFVQNGAGAVSTAGNITTSGDTVNFLRAVTLTGDITIDTTDGGGSAAGNAVTFQTTLTGTTAGADDLTITAGTGGLATFTGAAGGTRLGALLINSAGGGLTFSATPNSLTAASLDASNLGAVQFTGAVDLTGALSITTASSVTSTVTTGTVSAASVTITNGGAVDLNAAVTAAGGFSTTGTTFDNTGGSITTTDNAISIIHSGNVTIGAALSSGTGGVTAQSTGGTVTVSAAGSVTTSTGGIAIRSNTATASVGGAINTASGAITIDSSTGTTMTAAGDITATGAATVDFGSLGTGALSTAGDITTAGGAVRFWRAVTLPLASDIVIDTTDGGGAAAGANVDFDATLTGTTANSNDLTITAGTGGSVTFTGAAGATRLGAVLINSAGGGLTFSATPSLTAVSLNASNLGAALFSGAVNLTGALSITTATSVTTTVTTGTVSAASVTITSGGAVDLNAAVTAAGGFDSTGTTFDNTGGSITTTGTALSVVHTGNVIIGAALSSGAGPLTVRSTGGDTDIDATVNTTSGTVTMQADAGALNTTAVITSTTGAVSLTADAGTVSLGAAINTTSGAITIDSGTSTSVDPAGDITASGAGTVDFGTTLTGPLSTAGNVTTNAGNITFHRAVTLTGDISVSTTALVGGNILFSDDVDGTGSGTEDLTLAAGTGSVTFAAAAPVGSGAGTELGAILVNSALDVTFGSTVEALSYTQNAGTGTTTFDGAVTINGAGGIDINTVDVTFNAAVGLNPGSVLITNTGQLTLAAAADFTISAGSFTQDGAGPVLTAADIIADAGAGADGISINGQLVVNGDLQLNTAASGKNIRLAASSNAYIGYTGGTAVSLNAGTGSIIIPGDLHIYIPGAVLELNSDITAANIVLYAGTVDANSAYDISVSEDLVILGSAYDPDDAESGVAGLFAYDNAVRSTNGSYPGNALADPNVTLIASIPITALAFTSADYAGSMTGLGSTIVTVGGNFYANGGDLIGAAAWDLVIPDNDNATVAFAEAYNLEVQNCDASGGWVAAAGVTPTAPNTVTVTGGGANWDIGQAEFMAGTDGALTGTVTVYDNVIRVEIDTADPSDTETPAFENDNNEIFRAVTNIALNNGAIPFTGTFTNAECTTSTNGAGDLSVFFIQVTGTYWNTDADGTTAGDADSTDRGRGATQAQHRTVVPNIDVEKAAAGLYQTLLDHHKNRIAHYTPAGVGRFAGVADTCRPVLVGVTAGKADHKAPGSYETYDAHNYFHLRYSEPVNLGGETSVVGMTITEVSGAAGAVNLRAESAFSTADEYGGYITAAAGAVTVEGYFSYGSAETFNSGSRDGTTPVSSFYRDNTGGENPAGAHGATIFVAGWSEVLGSRCWPGYLWEVSDPVGDTITVPANPYITDADGNAIEPTSGSYAKAALTVANNVANVAPAGTTAAAMPAEHSNGWDIEAPGFSTYLPGTQPVIEGVTLEDAVSGLINRIEFFFHDNWESNDQAASGSWNSSGAVNPHLTYDPLTAQDGIRDTSWSYPAPDALLEYDAFYLEQSEIEPRINTYNLGIETGVNNTLFTERNVTDDPYISLVIQGSGHSWTQLTQMWLTYIETEAYVTDLAGNLLRTTADPLYLIERIPPKIVLTLATVGGNTVYVRFSEPVIGDELNTISISAGSFTVSGGSVTITSLDYEPYSGETAVDCMDATLTLNRVLTEDEAVGLTVRANAASVFDRVGNEMDTTRHRITDVGIGVVEPVWASDGIHGGVSGTTGDEPDRSALHDFDGTGELLPRDIILQASILAGSYTGLPLSMFYDVDPPASTLVETDVVEGINSFWLPSYQSGFNPAGNTEARSLTPYWKDGALRNFRIPSSDPEMTDGNDVEFIFKLGDLFCARITDAADPKTLAPWSFTLRGLKEQRAGVTILNNVINPNNGEKTVLTYALTTSGMTTIHVLALDGSLVRVIYRGRQGTGTYTFVWDGRNNAGTVVARGMYFIRIIAPGIDETRKVLVVK